ncbi:MAG: integral rane protein [Herbinix sp.]|jgi:sugar lactone lactonase YvrE|nr:integral rane protein [Herbinix sp.]
MKKIIKAAMLFLIAFVVSIIPALSASASQATSYTYTMDDNGDWTRTQDAYLPDKTITELGLAAPDDIFIDQYNMLYIADSGNKRIVKYSINKGEIEGILTYEGMTNPRGVYVTKKGDIYVADPSAKMVFRFDKAFNFIESFGRPEAPSFSDTAYEPLRVSVDNGGNLYIIGEGVYNGVIQLAPTGEFLGYFTVNKTKLTFIQALQNAIFTRAQLANLVPRVPTTFSNIFIDRDNIVYTTTMGTETDGIKKHNTAGGNVFVDQDWTSPEMSDLFVDEQGIIYTSDSTGYINIYSSAGELIFDFGSFVFDLDISGLYSRLSSITVDNNGNIWTVDGDKGYLQSFKPTDYALMIYNAIGLYEEGRYNESLEKWTEVLRLNQMSVLAHDGVGKAYLHAEMYEDAMEHFVVSGNREFYSEAFWEVRNTWIQGNLKYFVALLVTLWLIAFFIKHFDKKRKFKTFKKTVRDRLFSVPVLGDFLFAFRVPVHPLDRFYDIRVKKKGTVTGASIIYVLFFIIFIFNRTSKAFIYQTQKIEDMDINAIVIGFFVVLILFIVCNYLVTSIKDGDGDFKQVYMIPAYGMLPYMVAMLSTTIMSYGFTFNETFMLSIIMNVGLGLSLIYIFLGFMTVHDYTVKETVISLIITAVFMIIAAIVSLIIFIMWEQLWSFLTTIGKEAVRNVLD